MENATSSLLKYCTIGLENSDFEHLRLLVLDIAVCTNIAAIAVVKIREMNCIITIYDLYSVALNAYTLIASFCCYFSSHELWFHYHLIQIRDLRPPMIKIETVHSFSISKWIYLFIQDK